MQSARYDVIIVGGAAVGSSTAYHLAAMGFPADRVAVIERDPTYSEAATPRSLGGIRQQFTTRENMLMSRYGMEFVTSIGDHLAVDGDVPDVGWKEQGYLFLASDKGLESLQQNHATQLSIGAQVEILDPAALKAKFPWINPEGLAAGSFGFKGEGWVDPYALLQAFKRKARSLGVKYYEDEVVGVDKSGGRIAGVTLKSGAKLACGTLINTAGTRGHMLAQMAGVDVPVRPRKRIIYVFDCREPPPKAPLTIDTNGVFFRPEGPSFVCGVSPEEGNDPDCLDFEIDYSFWEELVWPTIANRVPAFEAVKLVRAWAGHYDYNILDQNVILGPHPDCPTMLLANGFSGHGLQQSPAAGRALAELVIHGGYRSLDLTRFGYERVLKNDPIIEANVW